MLRKNTSFGISFHALLQWTHWCEVQQQLLRRLMVKTALDVLSSIHLDGVNFWTWPRLKCMAKWFTLYAATTIHSVPLLSLHVSLCVCRFVKSSAELHTKSAHCDWICLKNRNDFFPLWIFEISGENYGKHFIFWIRIKFIDLFSNKNGFAFNQYIQKNCLEKMNKDYYMK